MKDLFLYPFRRLKYSWGGFVVMLTCGIYLAIQDNPGFLIGITVGIVLVYIALLLYKLLRK